MSNWDKYHLEDVCLKITDGTHKTPKYVDEGIVFLSAKNVKNGVLDFSEHKHISLEENNQLTKRCKPETGDVMLSKSGSLGDAVVVPQLSFEFSIFESLALIKLNKSSISPLYLQQYLNSSLSRRYFWSIASGIAVKHLHLVDLRKMPIFVPPLEVQRRIVDFLEQWDTAIDKTEALIAAKERQFGWLQKSVLDHDFKSYGSHLSNYAGIMKQQKIEEVGDLKPLTVKLYCKGIEANERDMQITLSKRGRPYFQRFSGEFLIGRQNFHNGGFGIVSKQLDGFIASSAITTLEIDPAKLDPKYLFYFFSRKDYYLRICHIMDGTGQKELSDKQIMKLPVSIPSIEKQKEVVSLLDTAQQEINLLKQLAEKYKTQKRGLMQKMLTGEWRVKPEIVNQYMEE